MSLLKKKMLLAPILAVTLALLLVGTVSFLPQDASQSMPIPKPTSLPGATGAPLPTAVPAAQGIVSNGAFLSVLFGVAAVLVGAIIAWLLFSEKHLKKEINS